MDRQRGDCAHLADSLRGVAVVAYFLTQLQFADNRQEFVLHCNFLSMRLHESRLQAPSGCKSKFNTTVMVKTHSFVIIGLYNLFM